jgi:hypothetical protein
MSLRLNSTVFGIPVEIRVSGEKGVVTGFCLHQRNKSKQFYVEYKSGDGRAVGDWFYEDQLKVIA